MRKIIVILFCLLLTKPCWGLEWKNLHEKADKMSFPEAMAAADKNPDSVDALYILGLSYFNLHKDKEAESVFKKILEKDPGIAEVRWGIAESLRRQHKLDEAEEELARIIKEKPDFYPAYISLAYIKYIRTDFEAAVRLILKVLQAAEKLDLDNHARAHTLYAGAKGTIANFGGPLSKIVNGNAAKRSVKEAELLKPEAPVVMYALGNYYLLAPAIAGGDLKKAEEYLNKTIQADPLFVDAYVRLAQFYRLKGDKDKFDFYLDKALEIDPQSELALDIKSGSCKFICLGK